METNDPTNQRLIVAKDLAEALISQHVSAGEQSLDLLSVVAFGATADVVYGLGDPAGAVSLFDTITPMSGTFIGSGITATIDDLKSSNNLTAGRTGLVIFSDGVDNSPAYTTRTIASLRRARDLDIRVSFGYIYPDAFDLGDVQTKQALIEIQSAVQDTGGLFITLGNSSIQQELFVTSVLSHGLTESDDTSRVSLLYPGLSVVSTLLANESATFIYNATAGEHIDIKVRTIDPVSLILDLYDASNGRLTSSMRTGGRNSSMIAYQAVIAETLNITVSGETPLVHGNFEIGVISSLNSTIACANLLPSFGALNSTPIASTTTNISSNATSRPTQSISPTFEGQAASSGPVSWVMVISVSFVYGCIMLGIFSSFRI
jgi:hypothetical protein